MDFVIDKTFDGHRSGSDAFYSRYFLLLWVFGSPHSAEEINSYFHKSKKCAEIRADFGFIQIKQ